jgi:hypothetical protein
MRILAVLASLLCLCTTLHAAPATQGDEMERLLAERGLLERVSGKASELVVSAMGALGVPYRRGGTQFNTGFDCSGFVRAMYEQTMGLLLPRRAEQQAAATQKIKRTELQPGDLVFFNTMRRTFSHVGIYVGDNKFIHSPRPGAAVRIDDMRLSYWSQRFNGARRVATEPTPAPEAREPSHPAPNHS